MLQLLYGHQGMEIRRMMRICNIAMDWAVNSLMVKAREATPTDFKTLGPKEGDGDDGKHKYSGLYPTDADLPEFQTFEWYFAKLLEGKAKIALVIQGKGKGKGQGEGKGKCQGQGQGEGEGEEMSDQQADDVLEEYSKSKSPTSNFDDLEKAVEEMTPDQREAAAATAEREGKKAVQKAVEAAQKGRGTVPGNLKEAIQKLLEDKEIPWQRLLSSWITNCLRKDRQRSQRRPKRRTMEGGGCDYPGRISNDVYTLVFAVDTSGSMGAEEIAEALAEVQSIQRSNKGVRIRVIEADTRIHKEYDLGPTDEPHFEVSGRGGTDFDCVFARMKSLKADALIYATDGYAPMPAQEVRIPSLPVIWVITSNGTDPRTEEDQYGKLVKVKRKEQD